MICGHVNIPFGRSGFMSQLPMYTIVQWCVPHVPHVPYSTHSKDGVPPPVRGRSLCDMMVLAGPQSGESRQVGLPIASCWWRISRITARSHAHWLANGRLACLYRRGADNLRGSVVAYCRASVLCCVGSCSLVLSPTAESRSGALRPTSKYPHVEKNL